MTEELNLKLLTKHILQQINHVTCLECCKYYVAPTTAACGHTLCNGCWRGRRKCPVCMTQIDNKHLKINVPLQSFTTHVNSLGKAFEKLFNINLDEFDFEKSVKENIEDWLTNSQNNFFAPISNQSSQDLDPHVEILTSTIQVHTANVRTNIPSKVIHIPMPQDDWDKIEEITENKCLDKTQKQTEVMNIEPLVLDDNKYTSENPRKSTRKKQTNSSKNIPGTNENIDATSGTQKEKSCSKEKRTWHTVKKMRKEFSKLNKENRNKLNVSIEMCKKAQGFNNNTNLLDQKEFAPHVIDNLSSNSKLSSEDAEPRNVSSNQLNNFVTVHEAALNKNSNQAPAKDISQIYDPSNLSTQNTSKIQKENCCDIGSSRKSSRVKFFKKSNLQGKANSNFQAINNKSNNETNDDDDDIGISIKIGKTITNICIKKKERDIQFKICTDQETQTPLIIENTVSNPIQNDKFRKKEYNLTNKTNEAQNIQSVYKEKPNNILVKSNSTGTNTEYAEKQSTNTYITESAERALSDIMEAIETSNIQANQSKTNINQETKIREPLKIQNSMQKRDIPDDIEYVNDLDIFDCESMKSLDVQLLKSSKNIHSAVLVPTLSKTQSRHQIEKRVRDSIEEEGLPSKKRQRVVNNINDESENETNNTNTQDRCKTIVNSNEYNYEHVMGKVFANIDADIKTVQKDDSACSKDTLKDNNFIKTQKQYDKLSAKNPESENVFSILENDNCPSKNVNTQEENEDFGDVVPIDIGTPIEKNYDSDNGVVEETPQKKVSILKIKQKGSTSLQFDNKQLNLSSSNKENKKKIIDLSESLNNLTPKLKEKTTVEKKLAHQALTTPSSINKFVDEIKHKSTPLARKSLNFVGKNIEEPEEDIDLTLCPSSVAVAKTTQEKKFMKEVFEQVSSISGYKSPVHSRRIKYCIAGSCLNGFEVAELKHLCKTRGWSYVDKYTKDLTHLVVNVDEYNKSKRSVKYMCALAASKWIISYAWVKKCLQTNTVVPEEPFETLDVTGKAGPRRSRLAKRKLFQGITFFCMPPFSILDADTLKEILEAAGGRVVKDIKEARVVDENPTLLLAEPEHTQEDRFIYLAMELNVVPVNFEWVMNSLGSYTLESILELLLCPPSLLPPVTKNWPVPMLAQDSD
ncbi:breast cancer type 1 susceptibility protein homolog [Battus philenor]|uniref:breast cancer type 1 susceptibility protein homolog n=1 Tax=Battus philenor TaxID=42288 RepID=UPI0035D03904